MAESFAFANRGVIKVGTTTIGVVKDVDIAWSAEHVPLYGWGSIVRQAVARHSQKVSVKIGFCKFDPTKTTWFAMGILTGTAGSMTGATVNTNTVALYTIDALFTMEDGTLMRGVITNVFFPEFPMKAAEGQWVKIDLSGEGSDIVWSNA